MHGRIVFVFAAGIYQYQRHVFHIILSLEQRQNVVGADLFERVADGVILPDSVGFGDVYFKVFLVHGRRNGTQAAAAVDAVGCPQKVA